jgi:hypothetical protein
MTESESGEPQMGGGVRGTGFDEAGPEKARANPGHPAARVRYLRRPNRVITA